MIFCIFLPFFGIFLPPSIPKGQADMKAEGKISAVQ